MASRIATCYSARAAQHSLPALRTHVARALDALVHQHVLGGQALESAAALGAVTSWTLPGCRCFYCRRRHAPSRISHRAGLVDVAAGIGRVDQDLQCQGLDVIKWGATRNAHHNGTAATSNTVKQCHATCLQLERGQQRVDGHSAVVHRHTRQLRLKGRVLHPLPQVVAARSSGTVAAAPGGSGGRGRSPPGACGTPSESTPPPSWTSRWPGRASLLLMHMATDGALSL